MITKRLARRGLAALAAATMATTLAACGTTDVKSKPSKDATNEASSANCADDTTKTSTDPVDMKDMLGREVKLDKPAERVVVLEWQQTEDLLTLCVDPVGAASTKDYATYVKAEALPDSTKDIGERGEPDLDTIYGLDPDLIVVEAYDKSDKVLAQLEKRDVPVLATIGADAKGGQLANMRTVFEQIAEATGRSDRAEAVLKDYDEHLDEAKKEVADADMDVKDFVFFDGWKEGGNVVIRPYGEGALFTELGEELGMKAAWTDEIDKSYGSGGVDPAYGLAQTDIEGLTAVGEANLFYGDDETPDSYAKDVVKSSIWKNLPAVKEGRAYAFPAGVWGAGGPKSNELAVDAFVEVIKGASDK
ncbi:MAG: iron-siderophore ABC transporter substrate-binding protein [Galactobacter sp.]